MERDSMTIRERIIGWCGGVGRGEFDALTGLYEAPGPGCRQPA